MAVAKTLKILGIAGGGLLLAGGGAVGSYYAQPYLEEQFHPERKEGEIKLKQSLDEKSDEVIALGHDLNKQNKSNKSQENEIFKLSENLKDLNKQVDDKQTQIEERDRIIAQKTKSLDDKTRENEQQSVQIEVLKGNLKNKETEVNRLNAEKTKVEGELNSKKDKLALTKENILDEKALKISSLNIEIRKIEYKKFEDGKAIFETDKINNGTGTVTFKVKYDENFPDREEKANYLRTKGISFDLHSSFDSWEKTISLNRWDLDYESKASQESDNRKFSRNKEVKDFTITEYFKPQYVKDAFKVLVAIGQLDHLPLCLELNSPNENLFNFCSNMKSSQNYASTGSLYWDAFDNSDVSKRKLEIWTNRFKTTDGFMGYWFEKTVEFIRTGTVDFTNLLNPVLLSKNYRAN